MQLYRFSIELSLSIIYLCYTSSLFPTILCQLSICVTLPVYFPLFSVNYLFVLHFQFISHYSLSIIYLCYTSSLFPTILCQLSICVTHFSLFPTILCPLSICVTLPVYFRLFSVNYLFVLHISVYF